MSFEIKATNVFESSNRSGAFLLRLVDAKFALPKKWEDASQKFICLDIPEYPTEHDDITLTFDNEEGDCQDTLLPLSRPLIISSPRLVCELPTGAGQQTIPSRHASTIVLKGCRRNVVRNPRVDIL